MRAFLGPANGGNLHGASTSGIVAAVEGEGGRDDHPRDDVNAAED